jgi:hypothetical protein
VNVIDIDMDMGIYSSQQKSVDMLEEPSIQLKKLIRNTNHCHHLRDSLKMLDPLLPQ